MVVKDSGVDCCVDSMEDDIIAKVMTEEAYLAEQHGLKLGRGVDMKGSCAAEQSEGGYHADKPKTVVAMDM